MSEKHTRYPTLRESIRRKFSPEKRLRYLGDASLNSITARLRESSGGISRIEVRADGPGGMEVSTFSLSKSGKLKSDTEYLEK